MPSRAPDLVARTHVGLPSRVQACLFDLDGVLTPTADLHAQAWQELFEDLLGFGSFSADDYLTYVDGKLRDDGVRAFLASRDIRLPDAEVHALGERKNEIVLELIARVGVDAYDDAIRFLSVVRAAGIACAVVSSSANCRDVLTAAGIEPLFDARVDGLDVARDGLRGKPAPDIFLAAATALAALPPDAAVFEDALAGVAAGRAGGFGLVVGVDRRGTRASALRASGADLVVRDLAELLVPA